MPQYADLESSLDAEGAFTDALMVRQAAELDLRIDAADDRTLQLDLDTEAARAGMIGALALLRAIGTRCPAADILVDAEPIIRPSKSGDGKHAWVLLKRSLSVPERIALQACLGSDPARELLSLAGAWAGRQQPIVLFRPKEAA